MLICDNIGYMEGQRIVEKPDQLPPPELRMVENPREFIEGFFRSKWYKDAFTRFYQGKTTAPEVTSEEKILTFEQSEDAKFALVDYGISDAHLKYNPDYYPENSQKAINIYLKSVDTLIKTMRGGDGPERIDIQDTLRYQYHEQVARCLVEDRIAPTEKLGRAIARLILIDQELDSESSAREPDMKRLRRRLGIK